MGQGLHREAKDSTTTATSKPTLEWLRAHENWKTGVHNTSCRQVNMSVFFPS